MTKITRDALWQRGWQMRDFTVGWVASLGPIEFWFPEHRVTIFGNDNGKYDSVEDLSALAKALHQKELK